MTTKHNPINHPDVDRLPRPVGPHRRLTIKLPVEFAQVSPTECVVILPVYEGPVLHLDALDSIAQGLSDAEKDRLSDDVADYIQNEAFKRQVRIA